VSLSSYKVIKCKNNYSLVTYRFCSLKRKVLRNIRAFSLQKPVSSRAHYYTLIQEGVDMVKKSCVHAELFIGC